MTMYLGIHGTRGSIPVAEKGFLEFGGNTSSYTVLTDAESLVFLDAGTGIRKASGLLTTQPSHLYLLLSHGHQDHIQGLGSSELATADLLSPLQLMLPQTAYNGIRQAYSGDAFPISPDAEMRNISLKNARIISGGETITLDPHTEVRTMSAHHPRRLTMDGSTLYRFNQEENSLVFATDFEIEYLAPGIVNPYAAKLEKKIVEFFDMADIVLCDGQFTKEEYLTKAGWGHPYIEQMIDIGSRARVKEMVFTHFDPNKDDKTLSDLEYKIRYYAEKKGVYAHFAREGETLKIG